MKYEALKTALKKMECHRSTSSRNHINAYSTKTYQKGPSSHQTRITVNYESWHKKNNNYFLQKEHDKEKEYAREFYNGADGICYDQQRKFRGLTREQFVEWVDQMAESGDIHQGEWQDNEWLGLTFVFNKSFVETEE